MTPAQRRNLETCLPDSGIAEDIRAALADLDTARAEAAALRARIADYEDDHRAVVAGQCAQDERHCSCVPHLRREVERLTENLRVARSDAATCGLIADAARRGTAEAMALIINHEGAIERLTEDRDALREEVEAMRAVVEEAERVYTTCEPTIPLVMQHLGECLDALRARKVGG